MTLSLSTRIDRLERGIDLADAGIGPMVVLFLHTSMGSIYRVPGLTMMGDGDLVAWLEENAPNPVIYLPHNSREPSIWPAAPAPDDGPSAYQQPAHWHYRDQPFGLYDL